MPGKSHPEPRTAAPGNWRRRPERAKPSVRCRAAASQESIDRQQDESSNHGDHDRAQVESGHAPESERARDEASDDRPDDPDDGGDDDPARVSPRHDQLGDHAGDQSEHDPTKDAHGQLTSTSGYLPVDRIAKGCETSQLIDRVNPGTAPA